jgi:hypothetical protein
MRAVPSTALAAAAAWARDAMALVPSFAAGLGARLVVAFVLAAAAFFGPAAFVAAVLVAADVVADVFAAAAFGAGESALAAAGRPAVAARVAVAFFAAGAALLDRLFPEPDFAAITRPPLGPSPVHRDADSEG